MTALPITRALISVSDKTGIVDFCRFLESHQIEILSTGGTAAALRAAGVKVKEVAAHTGFPEIMDGRVRTLHPLIHGGILARRDEASHRDAMTKHGIAPIDLLVSNLYPFEATVKGGGSIDECIENIDIGGPALIRAAAKNHDFVTVITDPADYRTVMAEMETGTAITKNLRRRLAAKAFARVADSPHGMVFADGALWVLAWKGNSSADSSIVRIELPSGKLTQSAALGANAWDLGVGFGRVWVAHGKQISVVDQKTLAPLADLAITVTDSMHLAIDTNAVYITDGGSVERIDPTSGQVTHKAMLGELVYVLQNAGEEIVAATQPGKIYRLDAATLAIKEILTPAKDAYEPADLHVAGPQLFVLTHASLAGGANKEAGTLFVAK